MMTDQDQHSNESRGKIGCLKLGCCGALVLGVLLVFAFGSLYLGNRRAVRSQEKALSALGHPTTRAELKATRVRPPKERDTTALWEEANNLLEGVRFGERFGNISKSGFPKVGEAWAQKEEAEVLLRDVEPALEKCLEAAALGGQALFDFEFSAGTSTLQELAKQRNLLRVLELDAFVSAHRGDIARASRAFVALFYAGEPLRNDPVLVSQLVRAAIDNVAVNRLQDWMPQIPIPSEDLLRIQKQVRIEDPAKTLQLCVDGERVHALASIRGENDAQMTIPIGVPGEESICLKFYEALDTVNESPTHEWYDALQKGISTYQEYVAARPWRALQTARFNVELGSSSWSPFINGIVNHIAMKRLCDVMIACELYRREQGVWPKDLEALVTGFLPSIPLDPFDGKPLRMLQTPEGVTLYSVGDDKVDNAGKLQPNENSHREPSLQLPSADKMPQSDSK